MNRGYIFAMPFPNFMYLQETNNLCCAAVLEKFHYLTYHDLAFDFKFSMVRFFYTIHGILLLKNQDVNQSQCNGRFLVLHYCAQGELVCS